MKNDPRSYDRNFLQLRKEAWKKASFSEILNHNISLHFISFTIPREMEETIVNLLNNFRVWLEWCQEVDYLRSSKARL